MFSFQASGHSTLCCCNFFLFLTFVVGNLYSYRVEGEFRVHVSITDKSGSRWEIPNWLVPRNEPAVKKNRLGLPQESLIKISYTQNPFGFAVTRISNNEVLFNSTPSAGSAGGVHSFNSMVLKDQYLEISTQIPASATLFGLGESTRPDGLPLAKGRTYTNLVGRPAPMPYWSFGECLSLLLFNSVCKLARMEMGDLGWMEFVLFSLQFWGASGESVCFSKGLKLVLAQL